MRPVRLYVIEAFDALDDNGDCDGVTVVLPDASVGDVPHVMDNVLDAPFEVPVPFNVADFSTTFVAGSVVTAGGVTTAGVTNDKIPPVVVLAPLAYVPLTSK